MIDREPITVSDVEPQAGFAEFYDRCHSPIRRALALAIGDVAVADEAVDEAMARAVASWEKIRGYERPQGWVYRVG
jgi:DNA-directed RNA polymerase specialized sigma24 family protein